MGLGGLALGPDKEATPPAVPVLRTVPAVSTAGMGQVFVLRAAADATTLRAKCFDVSTRTTLRRRLLRA